MRPVRRHELTNCQRRCGLISRDRQCATLLASWSIPEADPFRDDIEHDRALACPHAISRHAIGR